jgi:chemotaxis response regulator CheB
MEPQSDPDKRIKVLIIDDSALVRALLTRILGADPALQVIGTAPDAFIAREKIKALNPDVLTLDVEMPRMDGLQFLRNLMRLRPMPVVMCSSLTERGADVTLAALETRRDRFRNQAEGRRRPCTRGVRRRTDQQGQSRRRGTRAAAVSAAAAGESGRRPEKTTLRAALSHHRPDRRDRRLDRRYRSHPRGAAARMPPDAPAS